MPLRLFRSIFNRANGSDDWPESLVEAAIARAVEATDPRLRFVPGYRKRLREPIIHAIDQVVTLVNRMPPCVDARRGSFADDPCLTALFASAPDMLAVVARDRALVQYLAAAGPGAGAVSALLLADRSERNILGMDLVGDHVRREVAQVSVSFAGHRLLDPSADEDSMRRGLKRRAFDHLLTLALKRIASASRERADLMRQRGLLRRKLQALQGAGWSFDPASGAEQDEAGLVAELAAISGQLEALGTDQEVLTVSLHTLAGVLGAAEHQLWAEPVTLHLDSMNIQRAPDDSTAQTVLLAELHDGEGRRAVMLPIRLAPEELPPREGLIEAAARYL